MPEPCWQRVPAAAAASQLPAATGRLCSCRPAHTHVLWQHTEHPSHHPAPGSLLCQPGVQGFVTCQPFCHFLLWGTLKSSSPFKAMRLEKGNKFKDFYLLRAQIYKLHKPELLISGMRQSRSWLLIGSGPTFVWYWQSHLSAIKSWQNLPDSPLLPTSSIAKWSCFASCYGCAWGHLCGLFGK